MEPIKRVWIAVRRRWPVLFGCLAIALVAVSLSSLKHNESYTASTEVFLRAPDAKTSSSAYQGDLFSRQRAKTYIEMIQSDDLAQMVIDKLGLTIPPAQLISKIQATNIRDTVIIVISATDRDPQRAANLANGYGAVLADYVARMENIANDPNIPPLVQVVTAASAETAKPSGYPMWLLASGAVILSLLFGAAIIWLLERLDMKVRARQQVEGRTGTRVVGKLPAVRGIGTEGDVAAAFDSSNDFAQGALRLSVNVETILQDLPKVGYPPVLTVVASHLGEGSSVVTRSLARAFAERGRAVGLVLVDAGRDLNREGHLVMSGSKASDSNLLHIRIASVNGTLDARQLRAAIDSLPDDRDIVLVDSPPFSESVDAQIAVASADAVLLVMRPNRTKLTSLDEVMSGVELLAAPVVGMVANRSREASTTDGQYV